MKFFVLGVCLLGVMPVFGGAQEKCQDTDAAQRLGSNSHRVTVNFCSGEITGATTLRTRDSVQLLLVRKKPVGFKYEVKQDVKLITEDALAAFLPILGIPAVVAAVPEIPKVDLSQVPSFAREAVPKNAAGGRSPDDYSNRRDDLEKSLVKAKDTLSKRRLEIANSSEGWPHLKSHAATVSSADQGKALVSTRDTIMKDPPKEASLDKAEELLDGVDSLAEVVKSLAWEYKDERVHEVAHKILVKTLPEWRQQLATIREVCRNLNKNIKDLDNILTDSSSYYQVVMIPTSSDPRVVTITVTETPVEPKDAKAANVYTVKLQFGSARFTLSGGMVGAVLDREEYQISQGIVRDRKGAIVTDATGAEKTGPVVSIKEQSSSTLLPIAILHANLWDLPRGMGFHLSTGVTAKNDNKGTSVEYLFGPSLSFLDRHFFVTGGAFAARKQILADGLFLGAPADKLNAESLASKHLNWGWGFAISYKLK